MRPSEVRKRVLEDHEGLRRDLVQIEALTREVSRSERGGDVEKLRGDTQVLLEKLRIHMHWEELYLQSEAPEAGRPEPVPSRHQTTLGQDLRREINRFVLTEEDLRRLREMVRGKSAKVLLRMRWDRAVLRAVFDKVIAVGAEWAAPLPAQMRRAGWSWDVPAVSVAGAVRAPSLDALMAAIGSQGSSPVPDDWLSGAGNGGDACLILVPDAALPELYWVFDRDKGRVARFEAVLLAAEEVHDRTGVRSSMAEKRVGIVGLGSVGSKVATSLARSGVRKFVLVDEDIFLPENLCRNDLDWRDVGLHKVDAVASRIETLVTEADIDVRRLSIAGQESTASVAAAVAALGACDAVVDATASAATFCVLGEVCRQSHRPLVWMETFAGGAGGLVARCRPGREPDPVTMRSRILSWMAEQPDAEAEPAGPYEAGDGSGGFVVASDGDVAVIAGHSVQMTVDLLQEAEPSVFPYGAYLIGFKRGWIFDQPFHAIPIDVGEALEESPQEPQIDSGTLEFLKDALSRGGADGNRDS